MIYEYAVDPIFLTNVKDARFILEAFGRDKGRFISDTNNEQWIKWVRQAKDRSGNKTLEKAMLTEVLKILKTDQKAFYKRKNIKASNWEDLTQKAHKDWPYRGILVEDYKGEDPHYLPNDIYLALNNKWRVVPSQIVERCADVMISVASPLLELSGEVMMVDRNFHLENHNGSAIGRFKNVLIGFLNYLARKKFGPSVSKLIYHIGDQYYDKTRIEEHFHKYIKKQLPLNMRLEFVIWPMKSFHDRHIITEVGSLKYGIGLDEFAGQGNKKISVNRLSNSEHREIRRDFINPPSTTSSFRSWE